MVHDPSSREAAALIARVRRDQTVGAPPAAPTRRARIGGNILLAVGTLLVAFAGMLWIALWGTASLGPLGPDDYLQTGIRSAVVGIPGLAAGIWGWRLTHTRRKPAPDVSKVFD